MTDHSGTQTPPASGPNEQRKPAAQSLTCGLQFLYSTASPLQRHSAPRPPLPGGPQAAASSSSSSATTLTPHEVSARRSIRKAWLLAVTLLACDGASTAVVENGFSEGVTVYRAWWKTTSFDTPVPPGESSVAERTVPGTDVAWAVLQAADGGFTAVRSTAPLTLETRGDTLHIGVSAASVVGLCGQGGALSNEDALVAQRLFPAELAGGTYDQATCAFAP